MRGGLSRLPAQLRGAARPPLEDHEDLLQDARSFEDFAASPTLRDMINWGIEKPNEGVALATDSEAMKALEAYITWSNKGSPVQPSRAPGAAAPAEAVIPSGSPEPSTTVTVPAEEDRCPTGC